MSDFRVNPERSIIIDESKQKKHPSIVHAACVFKIFLKLDVFIRKKKKRLMSNTEYFRKSGRMIVSLGLKGDHASPKCKEKLPFLKSMTSHSIVQLDMWSRVLSTSEHS